MSDNDILMEALEIVCNTTGLAQKFIDDFVMTAVDAKAVALPMTNHHATQSLCENVLRWIRDDIYLVLQDRPILTLVSTETLKVFTLVEDIPDGVEGKILLVGPDRQADASHCIIKRSGDKLELEYPTAYTDEFQHKKTDVNDYAAYDAILCSIGLTSITEASVDRLMRYSEAANVTSGTLH